MPCASSNFTLLAAQLNLVNKTMGALCSKESDNFASPGRPVGSAPPQGGTSSVPKTIKVGGPPRTLGGASATNDSDTPDEARRKAAAAAEVCRPATPSPFIYRECSRYSICTTALPEIAALEPRLPTKDFPLILLRTNRQRHPFLDSANTKLLQLA